MLEMNRQYHEVANIFPLMQSDEFEALKADISAHGQHEPVWLHQDGRIIDGRNRHRACCELDIEPLTRVWNGEGSLVAFVVSLNLYRRHLSSSQKAMIGQDILPLLEAEAKERQRGGQGGILLGQKIDQANSEERAPRSTDQAAAIVGSNRQYISDAKRVVQEAPEVADMVRAGSVSMPDAKKLVDMGSTQRTQVVQMLREEKVETVGEAIKVLNRQARVEQAQSLRHLPDKVYNVIYADPPWEYNNTGVDGAAENHYPTIPTEKMKNLLCDIGLNLATNAVMFMWVTNPLLPDAFAVLDAWGFTYKTNMVWVKTELQKPGSGFYVRGRHELLFICTRGSFTPLDANISPPIGSIIESPVREHSRKPELAYEIIERLYPQCSYIELFGRNERAGWDTWGNETDKFNG